MRRLNNTLKRGLFPLLSVLIVLLSSFFSPYALVPDLPSNCEKLGVVVNQTQDGDAAYFWYECSFTCEQCGAKLYAFSQPFTSAEVLPNSYFFCSYAQYGQSAYQYSDCGQIVTWDNTLLLSSHTVANDRPDKWQMVAYEDPSVYLSDGTISNLSGWYVITHNSKLANSPVITLYSIVSYSNDSSSDAAQVYNIIDDSFSSVKAANPSRAYLGSVAVAFFAVPIYQPFLDDYYSDQISDSYRNGYNDGQINGVENSEAFELIPFVMDSVADIIVDTFSQLNFYGVSVLFIVFVFVVFSIILIFLRMRS